MTTPSVPPYALKSRLRYSASELKGMQASSTRMYRGQFRTLIPDGTKTPGKTLVPASPKPSNGSVSSTPTPAPTPPPTPASDVEPSTPFSAPSTSGASKNALGNASGSTATAAASTTAGVYLPPHRAAFYNALKSAVGSTSTIATAGTGVYVPPHRITPGLQASGKAPFKTVPARRRQRQRRHDRSNNGTTSAGTWGPSSRPYIPAPPIEDQPVDLDDGKPIAPQRTSGGLGGLRAGAWAPSRKPQVPARPVASWSPVAPVTDRNPSAEAQTASSSSSSGVMGTPSESPSPGDNSEEAVNSSGNKAAEDNDTPSEGTPPAETPPGDSPPEDGPPEKTPSEGSSPGDESPSENDYREDGNTSHSSSSSKGSSSAAFDDEEDFVYTVDMERMVADLVGSRSPPMTTATTWNPSAAAFVPLAVHDDAPATLADLIATSIVECVRMAESAELADFWSLPVAPESLTDGLDEGFCWLCHGYCCTNDIPYRPPCVLPPDSHWCWADCLRELQEEGYWY